MKNTTTKLTAANSKFLAVVKKKANTPIFKKVSAILNTEGEEAAYAYLGTIFRNPREVFPTA